VNYRLVLYWLLSMLALVACLWLPTEQRSKRELPAINLSKSFKVAPSFLYFIDNQFHAVAGNQLRIDLKKNQLKRKFPFYNTLVIEDLGISMNKTISLNWKVGKQQFRQPLNLTNTSVNRINFKTRKAKRIKDLHLLIEHNPEMGINHNMQDEVTFRAMYLTNGYEPGQPGADVSEWLDFSPVKFNSINGYTSADNTHLQSLIGKAATWLLINVLLYLILRVHGLHLLISITLAWVLTAIPYWYNFGRQHTQLIEAFPEDSQYLNALDKQAVDMSQVVKQALTDEAQLNSRDTKVVIVGPNEFVYLRLFYHLLEYDVAVHNNLKEIIRSPGPTLFVFFADSSHLCHQGMAHQWSYLGNHAISSATFEASEPAVRLLAMETDHCLVVSP